jgi:hypothetical protein
MCNSNAISGQRNVRIVLPPMYHSHKGDMRDISSSPVGNNVHSFSSHLFQSPQRQVISGGGGGGGGAAAPGGTDQGAAELIF